MRALVALMILFCGTAAHAATPPLEQLMLEDAMGRVWFGQQLKNDQAYATQTQDKRAETRLRYGQLWSRMNADEKKQAFNALPDDVKTSAADKINNRWNPSPEKQAQMLARAKKSASKNAVQPPKAPAHPTKPQAAPAKTDAPASDTTPPAWDEPR